MTDFDPGIGEPAPTPKAPSKSWVGYVVGSVGILAVAGAAAAVLVQRNTAKQDAAASAASASAAASAQAAQIAALTKTVEELKDAGAPQPAPSAAPVATVSSKPVTSSSPNFEAPSEAPAAQPAAKVSVKSAALGSYKDSYAVAGQGITLDEGVPKLASEIPGGLLSVECNPKSGHEKLTIRPRPYSDGNGGIEIICTDLSLYKAGANETQYPVGRAIGDGLPDCQGKQVATPVTGTQGEIAVAGTNGFAVYVCREPKRAKSKTEMSPALRQKLGFGE
ncbi:MAG: hypothetical protein WDO70_05155 [Alphaproteobacteria bacterium]